MKPIIFLDMNGVIDDTDDGISNLHPFVHTDSNVGLTADDVEKALKILQEQPA